MQRMPPRRVLLLLLVPLVLILGGTVGLHLIEGWSPFEALYFTVVTLTTIGYGDFVPKSDGGRVFVMVLVAGGVFTVFYAASTLISAVVSGEIAKLLGRRQMERMLAQLRDHLIVCGHGRMGRLVCRELAREKVSFVVIDANASSLDGFDLANGVSLVGDATSDDVLKHAGIDRARGLISVMASDADNLYSTMSARLLNAKLFIVARVEDSRSEQKLLRAGANRVVSPYQIGGKGIAQAVLRPTVVDFIELATRTEHIELQMEEARIGPGSPLAGASLRDNRLRADLKIIIVAIKKPSGQMVFNPTAETTLEAGDILVAIGHREQLDQLESLANVTAD